MNDCLFCKIVAGEIPSSKLYEDEHVYAFLDINPVNHGHALVIPKEHVADIFEISDEAAKRIAVVVKKLAIAIKEALNADGINTIQNNGAAAGQVIFHSHTHVIPRFEGDGHKNWDHNPYAEGEMEEVFEKIKKAL